MTDRKPNLFGTPSLRGEAAPGKFGFKTGDGIHLDASDAIFPIISTDPKGQIDLLGTGFFISTHGLFVSARHVLDAPFDRQDRHQVFPIAMIHAYGERSYLIRPILRCALHPVADVAVGVAAPMKRNSDGAPLTNPILTLTTISPDLNSHIVTFAYPRYENVMQENTQIFNVMPAFYDGELIEYLPKGRDRVLLPGSCYRTTIAIHHGASGGPVFSRAGTVFALNSTGFDGTEDSYVSSITPMFDLTVDDIAVGQQAPRSVLVREIARAGHILVDPL